MNEEDIIKTILDEAFYIHKNIGPGMLENSTKPALLIDLEKEDYALK